MALVRGDYRFLPWFRRGMATRLRAGGGLRAVIDVTLDVTVNNAARQATISSLPLYSAGDVHGIDPNTIAHMSPAPDAQQVEDNYFPVIEFNDPDLPWRYTPALPTPSAPLLVNRVRLLPWMCLIALKNGEVAQGNAASAQQPLSSITVNPNAPLPKLSQAWAWAHVQVSGLTFTAPAGNPDGDISTVELYSYLEANPRAGIARLVCPRRLDNRTDYTVFLVPTLMQGVNAGLGKSSPAPTNAMQLAWEDTRSTPIELPVYHRWHFSTGEGGDFELLISQLNNYVLPPQVGTRPLDVQQPGATLPAATATEPVALPGALKGASDLPDPDLTSAWETAIVEHLNRQTAVPMYGRWHAAEATLSSSSKAWLNTLNVDPRYRVAAALGTLVVQKQQQALMASAWQQVESIREINEALRRAQTSREMSVRLFERHITGSAGSRDADTILFMCVPYVHWLRCTFGGVRRGIADHFEEHTAIPSGLVDPQWRRVSSPFGAIGRRQGRDPSTQTRLFERFASGEIILNPPPGVRAGMVTWNRDPGLTRDLELRENFETPVDVVPTVEIPPAEINWEVFIQVAGEVFDEINEVTPPIMPESVDVNYVAQCVLDALEPNTVFDRHYRERLTLSDGAWQAPDDVLAPVWAAPTFPQPMYEPLRDISQDWMLPGLDQVPPNTVTLLETNTAFVEAYMAGLNHEMARELLWHGYPTDQRGSYFRQFWDISAYREATTPGAEQKPDIQLMDRWENPLGQNPNPDSFAEGKPSLILLVRGELLRRYPGAEIYAVKAAWRNSNNPAEGRKTLVAADGTILPENQRHPLFKGTLQPDISFFRFDLVEEDARGIGTDPGWFFVFQEPGREMRFGLDVASDAHFGQQPSNWRSLSWGHLLANREALSTLGYIDLSTPTPALAPTTPDAGDPAHLAWNSTNADSSASSLAWITLQRPVRVAIHARRLLPKEAG